MGHSIKGTKPHHLKKNELNPTDLEEASSSIQISLEMRETGLEIQ